MNSYNFMQRVISRRLRQILRVNLKWVSLKSLKLSGFSGVWQSRVIAVMVRDLAPLAATV